MVCLVRHQAKVIVHRHLVEVNFFITNLTNNLRSLSQPFRLLIGSHALLVQRSSGNSPHREVLQQSSTAADLTSFPRPLLIL